MQVGWAWLTPAEHDCWFQVGECIYCGPSGHFIATCPLSPKGGEGGLSSRKGVTGESNIFLSYLQIPATLRHKQISIPLLALGDSGAEDNVLDLDLDSQSGLPLEPLDHSNTPPTPGSLG